MVKKLQLLMAFLSSLTAWADIELPSLISDNMVIQQGKPFVVWGWAEPNERVVVEFQGAQVATNASVQGKWAVTLPVLKAGDTLEMSVKGTNAIKIHNILVGEVWVCSGQSNMEMPVKGWPERKHIILNSEKEVRAADYFKIRLFTVEKNVSREPLERCRGSWQVCTPETVAGFSATAYFFGREIHQKLNIPVGLIQSSWGNTPVEAWASKESLESDENFAPILSRFESAVEKYPQAKEKWLKRVDQWTKQVDLAIEQGRAAPKKPKEPMDPKHPKSPGGLYNAMIAPLTDYTSRGVIW